MEKRAIIVDFNPLVHLYLNSGHRLSYMGRDTTIQNGAIRNINKWANHGSNPLIVCFDSRVPARKAYFSKAFEMGIDSKDQYKGGRSGLSSQAFDAIADVKTAFKDVGITCLQAENYEADDLIAAAVKGVKNIYPGMPIDIITNDADIIPLVDEDVSVFLRSRKYTRSVRPDLEKLKYVQITPETYQEIVEDLSTFKKFYVPYNTVLLHKLLRGDPSDNIKGIKKKYPPLKYNELLQRMIDGGVDIHEVFRYGDTYWRSTDEAWVSEQLSKILEVLEYYTHDEETLDFVKKAYLGINLNTGYIFSNKGETNPLNRTIAKLKKCNNGYSELDLCSICERRFGIHLM